MTVRLRKFCICEQILQFCGRFHADRLKTVTWLPVAEEDLAANLIRVKDFLSSLALRHPKEFPRYPPPGEPDAIEVEGSRFAGQRDGQRVGWKLMTFDT